MHVRAAESPGSRDKQFVRRFWSPVSIPNKNKREWANTLQAELPGPYLISLEYCPADELL